MKNKSVMVIGLAIALLCGGWDSFTNATPKQVTEIGRNMFNAGALSMAYVIRDNPALSQESGPKQIAAAKAWWLAHGKSGPDIR